MLELLISLMISLGIQFTIMDDGKISISQRDANTLKSTEFYMESDDTQSIDDIVIGNGDDPVSESNSNE